MKRWEILGKLAKNTATTGTEDILALILANRGLTSKKDIEEFLHPPDPFELTAKEVGIDEEHLAKAIKRIRTAIAKKESIVVYADYDADGITAGAVMWEALHSLGATVMPYIPHRVDEGYGLSQKGIDTIKKEYNPTLIVTVDHGITAWEKVEYAKTLEIDIVITDHHVKPKKLPDCNIVHTTKLAGAGVSWFVAKELTNKNDPESVALAAIGTIADMVPLVGPNRSIAKYGLEAINHTKRIGLLALMQEAGMTEGGIGTYDVSHMLAPRLNAMGRLVHAMDALRLLCTKQEDKAMILARKLGLTNKERQQLTIDTAIHAKDIVVQGKKQTKKLLFVAHETYNQGVIGLVAGKLVDEYYRPAIVVAIGETVSKASARSIAGFNIVEAIRSCSDILIDVGGHPMAAGFTVETRHLAALADRLEQLAEKEIDEEKLKRMLRVDCEISLALASRGLWETLRDLEPFGFGNTEPVFATRHVFVSDARLVGVDGKHLKLRFHDDSLKTSLDAIAFGMGKLYGKLRPDTAVDIAYSIDVDSWNGDSRLQLKIKDIQVG